MFTGIIETLGRIERVEEEQHNRHFLISSAISHHLKPDESVAHNGVCLTVTQREPEGHWVTAVQETLSRTTLRQWTIGRHINLERSMPVQGRFEGHLVQGHVDQVGVCARITDAGGSWLFDFMFEQPDHGLLVEKGSICVDGVSLTCFNITDRSFRVAIIPYTFAHTTFQYLREGDAVNLEFDIIGKYVQRLVQPHAR
jgi:riboflavin synthase